MVKSSATATTASLRGVLKLLLVLVAISTVPVLGQEAVPDNSNNNINNNNNCATECGEVQKLHDKCVQDYWAVEEQRKASEAARGEERTQLEAQLEASKAEVANIQRLAQEEFDGFQAKEKERTQQAEEVAKELSNLRTAMKRTEDDLGKAKKEAKASRKELAAAKKELEEKMAARSIITFDNDLFQERVEEYKVTLMTHLDHAKVFLQEQLTFGMEKAIEFWHYVETKVIPEIVRFLEKDVLPLVRSTWKQAKKAWEEFYAPHREPVNQHIQTAKAAVSKAYQEHLEPHVKEHKIDQHVAHVRVQAEMYLVLAHSELTNAIDSGTGVALNFVKLQEWPEPIVKGLTKLHEDPEMVAIYLEAFLVATVLYSILMWLFTPKPKPKKPKKTKKQWEAEQASKKQMKNGHTSPKKKKN